MRPSFADGSHGIGLSGLACFTRTVLAALLLTSDGGRTWQRRTGPCAEPEDASLVTPVRGWLLCTGEPSVGIQYKSVYRTSDGGRTWERLLSVVPARPTEGGISLAGYALGISLAPVGVGLLWEGRGWLYLTLDSGRHWQPLESVDRPGLDAFGSSAAVVPGRAFALLGRALTRWLAVSTRGYGSWRTVRAWKSGR